MTSFEPLAPSGKAAAARSSRTAQRITLYDRLIRAIADNPGQTERRLADLLFGRSGPPSRLAFARDLLLARGRIRRVGRGGRRDPFLYYTTDH